MGNRTSLTKTVSGTTTVLESAPIDALGRVASGLDGEGHQVTSGSPYYIRSTMFGGEIVTTVDYLGNKYSGRVLDGGSLVAEQFGTSPSGSVTWHHRDPLNLVARDTQVGQVKRRVFAILPNGAQVETSEGVNQSQYYGCLINGNTHPSCTGYTAQGVAAYGAAANQASQILAASLKVDGALTLWNFSDIARQIGRTGIGQINFSPALSGTPTGAVVGAGAWKKRDDWHNSYGWSDRGAVVIIEARFLCASIE